MSQPRYLAGEIREIHTNMETLANQLPPAQASAMHYALNATRPGFDKTVQQLAGIVMHIKAKLADKCEQNVILVSNFKEWDTSKGEQAWVEEGSTPNFYEREFILHFPKEMANKTFEFKLVTEDKFWQAGQNTVVELKHYGHIADITLDHVKFA